MMPVLGSMLENPLSTSFSAIVRCMVGANGLSRQASSAAHRLALRSWSGMAYFTKPCGLVGVLGRNKTSLAAYLGASERAAAIAKPGFRSKLLPKHHSPRKACRVAKSHVLIWV